MSVLYPISLAGLCAWFAWTAAETGQLGWLVFFSVMVGALIGAMLSLAAEPLLRRVWQ